MRFLFTINRLNVGSGGAQRVVSLLANGVSNMGHDVLIVLYEERTNNDYYISENVNVEVLKKRNTNQSKLNYLFCKLLELRRIVVNFQPDVIVPFLSDPTWYVYLATRFTGYGSKIVTTVRNNPKLFPIERKYRWRNNLLIALSKACFCQNDSQRQYFPRFIRNKTFVIPNPVGDELLEIERQEYSLRKLLTFGRLSEQKNHKMMIEAFSKIVDKHEDITLDIYGDGLLRDELQQLIDSLELSDRVYLRGITNDIKGVLYEHGLFIMTSNFEGMPNALIEAMASGLPCVSTDCPTGPSDLIKNYDNGILVSVGNIEQCTDALSYLIDNEEQSITMGRNAKEFIKNNLSCDTISSRFVACCERFVVGGRNNS